MCAYKADKDGSCFKDYPCNQSAIVALDIKNKQPIANGIHRIELFFYVIKALPIRLPGYVVPTLQGR